MEVLNRGVGLLNQLVAEKYQILALDLREVLSPPRQKKKATSILLSLLQKRSMPICLPRSLAPKETSSNRASSGAASLPLGRVFMCMYLCAAAHERRRFLLA